ncbi:MAG: transcriptional repressor [Bacteroidaceae bacterium]|nr:transcriptional repressor [Bacteroidaceae bacterium]
MPHHGFVDEIDEFIENPEARLVSHGVKPTSSRLLVFRELACARHPYSIKDLEDRLLTVDKSTIFRTLTLLLQHHLIHAIEDGSGALKYELCCGHDECTLEDQHTHFYCEHCHRTFCLHDTRIPQIVLPEGFVAQTVNYMIKGLCPECHVLVQKKMGNI